MIKQRRFRLEVDSPIPLSLSRPSRRLARSFLRGSTRGGYNRFGFQLWQPTDPPTAAYNSARTHRRRVDACSWSAIRPRALPRCPTRPELFPIGRTWGALTHLATFPLSFPSSPILVSPWLTYMLALLYYSPNIKILYIAGQLAVTRRTILYRL